MLVVWGYWGFNHRNSMSYPAAQKTVADRLQEYGPKSRARLKLAFEAKRINYPPPRLVLVGLKAEELLQIYAGADAQHLRFIDAYPILAASGVAGPKLREGDQQVPEGIYPVESLNPNSKYHLSLRIGYPSAFDREHAAAEQRTNLGGDIMIHGGSVSEGCLAMGDAAAEDLFVLAADTGLTNITVILSPVDFRAGKTVPPSDRLPAWTEALYQTIRSNLTALPPAE
jgi:murein L,D-transpeptidase YafK